MRRNGRRPQEFCARETRRRSRGFRNELLYTGRRSDPETGLQLNRYRFYHQQLGRWVSRDPIGYWGGTNLYAYVRGYPSIYVDPWGFGEWNPAWPNWHHELPTEVFEGLDIPGVDINAAEYGFVLPAGDHQGLHPGWNEDWKDWLSNQTRPIDKATIDAHLATLRSKYAADLQRGFKPRHGHKQWRNHWQNRANEVKERLIRRMMGKARKTAVEKTGKCGAKKLPLLGIAVSIWFFAEDAEAIGFWPALGHAAADATPILGQAKGVYEITDALNDYISTDVQDEEIADELWEEMTGENRNYHNSPGMRQNVLFP